MILPRLDWIPKKARMWHYETLLKLAIFGLLVFALTSPISYESITPSQKHGRNIILALDTSGSMRESGFSQKQREKTKFELLLSLASDFIDKRPSDNIGVVAFGTFAFSASPVSYDHQSLKELLTMLEVEIAGKNTAIGDAIAQSITTLSFAQAKEKIIILITDGITNAGETSVKDAVKKAQENNIKVYTIGLGTTKEYDAALLQKIASETHGKHFSATNAKDLQKVYEEINTLLPSAIRSEQYLNKKSFFIFPLLLATLLLMGLIYQKGSLS